MTPRTRLVLAVVLPLVVIAIGIVDAERHLATARRWVFDVAGYDPRDLLHGHYLLYNVALDEGPPIEECPDDEEGVCCLCLDDRGDQVPPHARRATCATARGQCAAVLQTRYLATLRRYYIAEADADRLTRSFQEAAGRRQARLVVAIDDRGVPRVDRLLLNGVPIEQTPP